MRKPPRCNLCRLELYDARSDRRLCRPCGLYLDLITLKSDPERGPQAVLDYSLTRNATTRVVRRSRHYRFLQGRWVTVGRDYKPRLTLIRGGRHEDKPDDQAAEVQRAANPPSPTPQIPLFQEEV